MFSSLDFIKKKAKKSEKNRRIQYSALYLNNYFVVATFGFCWFDLIRYYEIFKSYAFGGNNDIMFVEMNLLILN